MFARTYITVSLDPKIALQNTEELNKGRPWCEKVDNDEEQEKAHASTAGIESKRGNKHASRIRLPGVGNTKANEASDSCTTQTEPNVELTFCGEVMGSTKQLYLDRLFSKGMFTLSRPLRDRSFTL